ncbi:uncharacterized protein LOC126381105 isoform X2 [Pectinophora gossypiella]|uniref:uncharacterized protein LOC126381105 isoform X2 n=1 Tax=Pectinophora gossypiella TaxID=13191 RepID=UPI00214F34D6|nr:uncharacterized protein LOC126381105 isoform X2 [Pectinophora gossypiella]
MEGEAIASYVAALKKLARTCDFGTSLEENLRDQLICGITSETTRQRLFAEDDSITYNKAVKLAITLEAAEKNASAVDANNRMENVNKVHLNHKCMACGEGHKTETCRYKNFECSYCRSIGHLRRMCPDKGARFGMAGMAGNRSRGDSVTFHNRGRGGRYAGVAGGRGGGSRGRSRGGGQRSAGSYWVHGDDSADLQQHGSETVPLQDDVESSDCDELIYQMSLSNYKPA